MTEWVDDGALEHPADRARSTRRVSVFPDRTVLGRSNGQRVPVRRERVVPEELDPDRRETGGSWTARAVRGRFVGEIKGRAISRQPGNNVASAIKTPKECRAKGCLVEL